MPKSTVVPQATFFFSPPTTSLPDAQCHEQPSDRVGSDFVDNAQDGQGALLAAKLRFTKGALEHAERAGVSRLEVSAVLADAERAEPDRDRPDRMRFTRGPIVVVAASDGTVLAVFNNTRRQ